MTKAGGAPALAVFMPEFAPPQLPIEACPDDFGCAWNKTKKRRTRFCKHTHTLLQWMLTENILFFLFIYFSADTNAQAI